MGFDPHAYTSGRWLRDDKLERDARYIKFDFDALCQKVLNLCPGADGIKACQKIEGGFNRVFIFTLTNGKRIVTRLPFAVAGPAKLTTASEVATIKYLQANTTAPIPEILDWNDDANANNSVGSEYIIMEHAEGVPLNQKWPEMAGDEKVMCINAIYQKLKEVVDLGFPAYGSLYFRGSEPLLEQTVPLDKEFCIGPHCGTRYWDCNVGESKYYHNVKPNHGPWTNVDEYCDGLIDVGLARVPPVDPKAESRPSYHGSIQTHLNLLECARSVLKQMSADPRVQESAAPLLFHPDLHKRNVFVSENDPSIITAIIDWQAASVEPSFWYADEVPDFATPTESGNDICLKAFEVCTQFLTPKLAGPRLMDDSLFRPFRYSYRTWKDGAVALRHDLIETAHHWKDLGFSGQCAYPVPTPTELADHRRDYKLFEAAYNLKRDLAGLLDTATDGWMPPEQWETTKQTNKEMFKGMLHEVLTNEDTEDEPVTDEAILRSIWPFDLEK